jgi:hypothetical protein
MIKAFAKIWVHQSCRFAMAAPPDVIKQQDPMARAWMYLGGDIHEAVGKSHVELARDGIKSGKFGPQHIKDLTGDPPMGRAMSEGTTMGLWFTSQQAMTPPFSVSMQKAIAAGMVQSNSKLVFLDNKEMMLSDYLNALKQAEMEQVQSAGVPVPLPSAAPSAPPTV